MNGQTTLFDFSGRPTAAACRREALESLSPVALRDQHRKIIECLARWPSTDEEIQGWTELSPSSERPRRGELVEMGIVEESGEVRPTKSGRNATVWTLVKP